MLRLIKKLWNPQIFLSVAALDLVLVSGFVACYAQDWGIRVGMAGLSLFSLYMLVTHTVGLTRHDN